MMLDTGTDRVPLRRSGLLARLITSMLRLILPVTSLVTVFLFIFYLSAEPASEVAAFVAGVAPTYDPSSWLNWGFLLLPLVFFILNLTSRRYGAALTLVAALLPWLLLGGVVFWALREGLIGDFESDIVPYTLAASFVGAMALAQLINILFFDWMRGIPWWKAPFLAALLGGIVFSCAFNMSPGSDLHGEALRTRLSVEAVIHLAWAIGQLPLTMMLRRKIRPLPGFGGM